MGQLVLVFLENPEVQSVPVLLAYLGDRSVPDLLATPLVPDLLATPEDRLGLVFLATPEVQSVPDLLVIRSDQLVPLILHRRHHLDRWDLLGHCIQDRSFISVTNSDRNEGSGWRSDEQCRGDTNTSQVEPCRVRPCTSVPRDEVDVSYPHNRRRRERDRA